MVESPLSAEERVVRDAALRAEGHVVSYNFLAP